MKWASEMTGAHKNISNIIINMERVVTHSGRIRPDESRITSLQNSISGSEGFTLT